jgi:probable rRNA maturation factor
MSEAGDSTPSAAASESAVEAEPPDRLHLDLVTEAGDWSGFGPLPGSIHALAAAIAAHPGCRGVRGREAAVALADDARLRHLNGAYRGKDGATNVLSFPFQAPPGATAGSYLGDIVLAAETVRREAHERGIAPSSHLQHLVVHGVLHLLGHDHEDDAQAAWMERLETEILAMLGIADPHAERPC